MRKAAAVLLVMVLAACKREPGPAAGGGGEAAANGGVSKEQGEGLALLIENGETGKAKEMVEGNALLANARAYPGGPHDGWPMLMIAARNGHKEMAAFLIAKGAEVNAKNDSDEVPLHYAALGGHREMVELLIEKGADVNAKSVSGATPLTAAQMEKHDEVIAVLKAHGAKE